jgi:hypothetical protein
MTDKFKSLRSCADALERLKYFGCDKPKCPHCGYDCDVSQNEWWRLYEEGEHEVTCPSCDNDFTVSTRVSYSFSTDQQDDDEEDGA